MAYKYLVTLTPGDDGYIVAECPTLPGCVSQGKTREEALRNIQEAIEGIIEVRKAQKLPIPISRHRGNQRCRLDGLASRHLGP